MCVCLSLSLSLSLHMSKTQRVLDSKWMTSSKARETKALKNGRTNPQIDSAPKKWSGLTFIHDAPGNKSPKYVTGSPQKYFFSKKLTCDHKKVDFSQYFLSKIEKDKLCSVFVCLFVMEDQKIFFQIFLNFQRTLTTNHDLKFFS